MQKIRGSVHPGKGTDGIVEKPVAGFRDGSLFFGQAFDVFLPWFPVGIFPSRADVFGKPVRYIGVHEFKHGPVFSRFRESEDQDRIRILSVPVLAPPGLHNHLARLQAEDFALDIPVVGAERGTGLFLHNHFLLGDFPVDPGIHVTVVKSGRAYLKKHLLFDNLRHMALLDTGYLQSKAFYRAFQGIFPGLIAVRLELAVMATVFFII
jgi:hypothetical protein